VGGRTGTTKLSLGWNKEGSWLDRKKIEMKIERSKPEGIFFFIINHHSLIIHQKETKSKEEEKQKKRKRGEAAVSESKLEYKRPAPSSSELQFQHPSCHLPLGFSLPKISSTTHHQGRTKREDKKQIAIETAMEKLQQK